MEPSSVAGTGTLWPGVVLPGSSLGGGKAGAEAFRVSKVGTMTLSRGSGVGRSMGIWRVRIGSQRSPERQPSVDEAALWPGGVAHDRPSGQEVLSPEVWPAVGDRLRAMGGKPDWPAHRASRGSVAP